MNRRTDVNTRVPRTGPSAGMLVPVLCCLLSAVLIALDARSAGAQEDTVKFVETKRVELKEKEEALKREEERLAALKKEVDEKIAVYSKLLTKIEAALTRVNAVKSEKVDNVVKAYEIMSAGDAAARLAALDNDTALQIISRMKSKKAGAIMAAMPPNKAAELTKSMAALTPKGSSKGL